MALSMLYTSRALRSPVCTRCLQRSQSHLLRWASTDTAPPLLAQMKADMKTAMRAKDTVRYERAAQQLTTNTGVLFPQEIRRLRQR